MLCNVTVLSELYSYNEPHGMYHKFNVHTSVSDSVFAAHYFTPNTPTPSPTFDNVLM